MLKWTEMMQYNSKYTFQIQITLHWHVSVWTEACQSIPEASFMVQKALNANIPWGTIILGENNLSRY